MSLKSALESRKAFDDLDDLVPAVSLKATELDQFTDSLHDEALLWRSGHGDAPPTLEVEQSLVPKDVQGPQHGVLIHAEDGCHVFGQGKAFSGSSFSLGDGSANFRCHLVMKRRRFCSVDLDIEHGTRHSRSIEPELPGPG